MPVNSTASVVVCTHVDDPVTYSNIMLFCMFSSFLQCVSS